MIKIYFPINLYEQKKIKKRERKLNLKRKKRDIEKVDIEKVRILISYPHYTEIDEEYIFASSSLLRTHVYICFDILFHIYFL